MAKIDSGSKSSRLLASRRYTHDTLTTAQESFTNVLDLQSSEVYTQAHLIPTSSLSHSGSTQFGAVYSTGGQNVTKYWYRHKLTPSNINNETWFFINPTGSDDGVGAQLINDNQEVSFVSPKYSVAALATSTVEDSTPGYLAVIYKSSAVSQSFQSQSLGAGDKVSTNDYQFDYKTGVVQFINSSSAPPDAEYVYMSVYQYVGKTLATGLDISGNVSGSSTSTGSFGRVEASTFSGDGSALTGVTAGALDIDSATDGTSVTVATTDLLLFSDGGTEKKMQMKQMAVPLASVISGSFTTASSSIDTRIEGIADPIAMAIALGG